MTLDFEVTGVPTDVVSGLSLTAGRNYSVELFTRDVVVLLRVGGAPPDTGDPGHTLVPRQISYISPDAGEPIWFWQVSGETPAQLVVSEA